MSLAGITQFDPRRPAGVITVSGRLPYSAERELIVAANERCADAMLWEADPEFAASLGIAPPLPETGHLRASFRPGEVTVPQPGVVLTVPRRGNLSMPCPSFDEHVAKLHAMGWRKLP